MLNGMEYQIKQFTQPNLQSNETMKQVNTLRKRKHACVHSLRTKGWWSISVLNSRLEEQTLQLSFSSDSNMHAFMATFL
jgi:hypothetical protein